VATARTLVFLDASVLVAASHSPSGGSAVSIEVCQGRRFRAVVTSLVLLEARTNIAKKFGAEELVRFYQQLAAMQPEIVPAPPVKQVAECALLTTEKDAHVLAAALACRASYLLTLDKRHLLTPALQAAGLPLGVMTPGDFLRQIAAS
jgi:predicted nucleic acid-binding protein